MTTITKKLNVKKQARKGQGGVAKGEATERPAKVPRIAKLMALAIYFDELIREGKVADQAELARVGHVSRARLTQIMNLLCLAPEIQEELLFANQGGKGRAEVTERDVRGISRATDWARQMMRWQKLRNDVADPE